MGTMATTLNLIMENEININKINDILKDEFNIIDILENEIYIKPERKENKDNLITKIKDTIFSTIGIAINPEFYVKIFKTNTEIVVRVKRIKRNSR